MYSISKFSETNVHTDAWVAAGVNHVLLMLTLYPRSWPLLQERGESQNLCAPLEIHAAPSTAPELSRCSNEREESGHIDGSKGVRFTLLTVADVPL